MTAIHFIKIFYYIYFPYDLKKIPDYFLFFICLISPKVFPTWPLYEKLSKGLCLMFGYPEEARDLL